MVGQNYEILRDVSHSGFVRFIFILLFLLRVGFLCSAFGIKVVILTSINEVIWPIYLPILCSRCTTTSDEGKRIVDFFSKFFRLQFEIFHHIYFVFLYIYYYLVVFIKFHKIYR